MVKLQLHRNGVALVAVGALFLGALLFGGGYLSGMRNAPLSPAPVVAKAKAKPPAVVALKAPVSVAPENLAVRAGLFLTEEEATAFKRQLMACKLTPTVTASPTASGAMLYSVSVGSYTNRRDAAAAAEALKRDLGIDGAIVSVGTEALQR
jgi:cell division protein FtsN